MRRAGIAALGAAGLLAAFVPAATAGGRPARTFVPPYRAGPSGGDQYNVVVADPSSGEVAVTRAYPYPGAFNCAGSGGFAYLRVPAVDTGPVSSVTLDLDRVAVDGYSWVSLLVRDAHGHWLGSRTQRGPLAGSARVTAPVAWTPALVGTAITIDFGLEVASACPNADGGAIHVADVVVAGSVRGTGTPAVAPGPPPPAPAASPGAVVSTVNFTYEPGDDDPIAGLAAPLTIVQGTGLVVVNADGAAPHTLTAVGIGRDGRPLFDSGAPIDAGQAAVVAGVERLAPGRYPFFCRVHTQMRGVLAVVQ